MKKLEAVVRTGKGPNGLPRGLLQHLMEFLEPFCSIVTLQKRHGIALHHSA